MNADPMKPTDAERAANAIVSLRNDEVMRHLSLHFHDILRNPAQPSRAGIPAANTTNPSFAGEAFNE